MNAQHSNVRATWYTPESFILAAREVLGTIDLDPASDAHGNEIVQAKRFITAEEDGLEALWWTSTSGSVSVWMNPPGRVARKKDVPAGPEHRPLPRLFWEKLIHLRRNNRLKHAIVAAFSIEQLQQSQSWGRLPTMLDFPFCIPSSRVSWRKKGVKAESPTHASAFIYVPGTEDQRDLFALAFMKFGQVVIPE